MKYAWISQHRDSFPVALMCERAERQPVGLLRLGERPHQPACLANASGFAQRFARCHAESHGDLRQSARSPKNWRQRDELESACRNTVAPAMRELGLKSRVSKTFTPTTTQADPTQTARREHAGSRLHGQRAEPQMGDRHHLPADRSQAGFTWPWSSTCSAARSWAGR